MCFVVRKTTSELECVILPTLYLVSAKNIDTPLDPPLPEVPIMALFFLSSSSTQALRVPSWLMAALAEAMLDRVGKRIR
jgi:hypothetical protein